MLTQTLGSTELAVSRLAYGCMRIAGTWSPDEITAERKEAAFRTLDAAYEAGYTFFDHADIYCRGGCERLHGEYLNLHPELRASTVLATKCGIRFQNEPQGTVGRYDFSQKHILWSCEQSLQRLGVERIDLYQLHRSDLLMNPDEVAGAFSKLHDQGKVRHFGVSNFLPSTVATLQESLAFPIVVNQIEVSLWRLAPFFDGVLDQCIRESIVPLSWGPVGGGRVSSPAAENDSKVEALSDALAALSRDYEAEPAVIAIAWLLKHPSGIVPIVGSVRPERIQAMTRALEIELTREEWYRLLVAARGEAMP